ncbi:MAG: peptidoglycan DD-metalloendopeptidase family protein [Anaerolineae bacterium]
MRERARIRARRWRQWLVALVLTATGFAMVRLGQKCPGMRTSPTLSRQIIIIPGSRHFSRAGRQWTRLMEEEALQVELSATGPAWETRAVGGPPLLVTMPEAAPEATPVLPRTEVITYTVQPGDNIYLISQRFGLTQDTVIWANGNLEMDPDLISVGQELAILPVNGVWHKVKAGETLATIAKRYGVKPEDIINYAPNNLQGDGDLTPNRMLIVPGGIKPFEPHIVYTEGGAVTVNARPEPGRFIWPCTGAITQYFHKSHLAIDIGNVEGTPVYAADSGTVTLAGWAGGLGNAVRINHGNGYVTTYGHFSRILVSNGDWVARGQQIGLMGSTGKSTGPHVHFVITLHGGAVNPIRYLPH